MSEEKTRRKFRWPHVLCAVCAAILLVAVVVGYMGLSGAKSAYDGESPVVMASISAIKGEIEALKARPPVERDEVADTLLAAQEKGNQVAAYQNEFKACYASSDVQAALSKNYKALMPLFDATDGTGWSVWFTFGDELSDKTLSTMNWRFMTNYTTGVTELPCLWMLRDGKGELVAYTTGVYDGNLGVFKDTDTFKTTYGLETYTDWEPANGQDQHTDDVAAVDGGAFGGGSLSIGADGTVVPAEGADPETTSADTEWASHFEGEYSGEYADVVNNRRQAAIAAGILNPDGTPKAVDGGEQP